MADGAVTSAKIFDATIATSDLANGSVTSSKIADSTITAADLAAGRGSTPGNTSGTGYVAGVGVGGSTAGVDGGNGLVYITAP